MIEFHESKNGEKTVSFGGKFLHSRYNPSSEGEKFAQNIQADFLPLCLILIEPALAYQLAELKRKFPNAKYVAIRFIKELCAPEYNSGFDGVFFLDESKNLSDELFEFLTEEELCSSLVIEWSPSKNIFPEKNEKAWGQIKNAILKSRDVLGTRSYFSKRWLKNSLAFFKNIRSFCTAKKTNLPVIVAASGRSLESSLKFLQEYRTSFFLIAVSSAFMPLITKGILPDLVISTDGGFWAKKHLSFPSQKNIHGTIFAFSSESAVPKKLLRNETVIPICYDDDNLQKHFFGAFGIDFMTGRRNGTVSGTAVEFALALTDNTVYCVGLDQAPTKGYQHTQPNSLEYSSQMNDFRLKPKETRLTFSQFSSEGSLSLYRNWFIAKSGTRLARVKRLSDNYPFDFSLGSIKDVDWAEFKKSSQNKTTGKAEFSSPKQAGKNLSERKKILSDVLERIRKTDEFKKEFFPMERLLILREKDAQKKELLSDNLEKKISEFLDTAL